MVADPGGGGGAELIDVGKEHAALELLQNVFQRVKFKQWVPAHEAVMLKYMEICVNLQKASASVGGASRHRVRGGELARPRARDAVMCCWQGPLCARCVRRVRVRVDACLFVRCGAVVRV